MSREVRITVVLDADTNRVTVDGPLELEELCVEILKAGIRTVEECNRVRKKSPILITTEHT